MLLEIKTHFLCSMDRYVYPHTITVTRTQHDIEEPHHKQMKWTYRSTVVTHITTVL